MLARQLQLLGVEKGLALHIQALHKKIQADLADRHQARIVPMGEQGMVQCLQICVLCPIRDHGVNAQGIGVATAMRQAANLLEIFRLNCGQDAESHTSGPSPFAHGKG